MRKFGKHFWDNKTIATSDSDQPAHPHEHGPGIKLQGDWGEIVALEGSKSPWEAQRATKTSPSVFATFEKANTSAKRTFRWEKSSEK